MSVRSIFPDCAYPVKTGQIIAPIARKGRAWLHSLVALPTRVLIVAGLGLSAAALMPQAAHATLCKIENHLTQDHRTEAKRIYDEPFGKGGYRGIHDYNARIIACNRWRDSIGAEIDDIDPKDYVYPKTMAPRIIKGRIRYFNVAPKRYGYRLERQDGTWILTVVADFHFPARKFPNRLDIPMELADDLGIANTICASTQTKIGGIDRGLVQIDGWPDACRLNREERINGVPVKTHLMEYWRNAITTFWSRAGFEVRLLITDLGDVPADDLAEYRGSIWPVRLNHNKNSRAMYRSSPHKPHPLYAGLDASIIVHEFGHVIGLDDEYPGSKNPPLYRDCEALGGGDYVMCDAALDWQATTHFAKGVYAWIVTRRYGFGESTDLTPVERPRTADAREHAPEPHEEEQTASGEYIAPPPPSELVDEKTRELANLDPTDTDVEASPNDEQPLARADDVAEGAWRDPKDDSLAQRDFTMPGEQALENPKQAVERAGNLAGNATRLTDPEQGVDRAGNLAGNSTRLKDPKQAVERAGNLAGNSTRLKDPAQGAEGTDGATNRSGVGAGIGGNLIAHFPLDGSPDNVLGEPGRIFSPGGTPPRSVAGKFGEAYRFGETKAVIAAPLDIDFETYPKLTITAWVKVAPERDASGGMIVSPGHSSSAAALELSHERIRGHSAGRQPVLYEGDPLAPGQWTLVAGVWDFEAHTMRLYAGEAAETFPNDDLDVARQRERKRNQPKTLPPDEDDPEAERRPYIYIGANDFGGNGVAEHVAIDDVRIYSGALDDQAIAAIRNGGPVRIAGRGRIGETEKNAPSSDGSSPSGSASMPGVPSGVRDSMDRFAQSEEFQEATEEQRQRRALEEQLKSGGQSGSMPGAPSSVSEATERLAQSEEFQEAAQQQRQRRELMERIESGGSGGSTGSGDDDGSDPDPGGSTESTGRNEGTGTVTRRQALEPAKAKFTYGDRIYEIGDISGTEGSYSETVTFHEDQAILNSIGTAEESDKPCKVYLSGSLLDGHGEQDQVTYEIENCRKGNSFNFFVIGDAPGAGNHVDYFHGIVGLQLCLSGNRADKRVKGARATTRRIRDDGTLATNTQTLVLFERFNCGSWANHSTCAGNKVATGAKVYFADGTKLAPKDYLSGMALMCSELQPVD